MATSDLLAHNTIKINLLNKNNLPVGSGTGFIFSFLNKDNKDSSIPTIITNKHVVNAGFSAKLLFTYTEDGLPVYNKHYECTITDLKKHFIFHPDPNIDLCLMPLTPIIEDAKNNHGLNLFLPSLDSQYIPSDDDINSLASMEEVIMTGYPIGLHDEFNNLPLMRKGFTSIHPKFNYNGKPDIVLDIASFPGSSGSPVCILNEGYFSKKGTLYAGSRFFFLGILYSGPVRNNIGDLIVSTIPTAFKPTPVFQSEVNIGYCIKSSKVLDFIPILQNLSKLNLK